MSFSRIKNTWKMLGWHTPKKIYYPSSKLYRKAKSSLGILPVKKCKHAKSWCEKYFYCTTLQRVYNNLVKTLLFFDKINISICWVMEVLIVWRPQTLPCPASEVLNMLPLWSDWTKLFLDFHHENMVLYQTMWLSICYPWDLVIAGYFLYAKIVVWAAA